MIGLLPENIAVVVLGPGGTALGGRLRTALAGARLHGPRAHPGDWDENYDRASTHIGRLFEAGRLRLVGNEVHLPKAEQGDKT